MLPRSGKPKLGHLRGGPADAPHSPAHRLDPLLGRGARLRPGLAEYRREAARIRETFEDVTLARFLDHLDHAVRVAGIDHVGLSGDFDGGGGVEGWDNAADSVNVTAALLERGYSEADLAKIWGGNLLRVMRDVQAAAE